jgi:hypothetical protein
MRTPTNPVPAVTTEGRDDTALHTPDDTTKKCHVRYEADLWEVHERYGRENKV